MHDYRINQEVTVNALYFRNAERSRELKAFPRRMEYGGREYTFIENGLRFLVRKGQQLVELFDMTDGAHTFRLKFVPATQQWTLIGMSDAA